MRIKIRFTHFFDLIRKILLVPLVAACGIIPSLLIAEISFNGFIQFLSFVSFVVGTLIGGYFLSAITEPLSTILYLFFSCGVKITYQESKKITFLFDGSLSGKWYPLTFLKNIPKEDRKSLIFDFAEKVKSEMYGNAKTTSENCESQSNEKKNSYNYNYDGKKLYTEKDSEYKFYCKILELDEDFTDEELQINKAYTIDSISKWCEDYFAKQ